MTAVAAGETPMDHTGDLRARVVALENNAIARERRITNAELWQRNADVSEARRSEQFKAMDNRFDDMEADIKEIKSSLTWIVRLILGGLVGGFFTIMVRVLDAAV